MRPAPLDTSAYDRVLVIDSQVVLEARPLHQLPWRELSDGPILLLVCRQVQSEVDAKKRDGRLGKRSREFNRQLELYFEKRAPVPVIDGPPRVDIALLANRRIDWTVLDTLDPDSGDDRIVAQALNGLVDDSDRLEILSHDLRPRDGAILHGMRAVKLPESWLLPPEPSAGERRLAALEKEVKVLGETQPRFDISIEVDQEPLTRITVDPPSPEQITAVRKVIMAGAGRPPTLERGIMASPFEDTDHPRRWAEWAKRLAAHDLPLMHRGLSRLYSQHLLKVHVENIGSVAAERMCVEISCGKAVLHSGPFYVQVFGPVPPQPQHGFRDPLRGMPTIHDLMSKDPFDVSPDVTGPGPLLRYVCQDFRQGRSHALEIVIDLDSFAGQKVQVEIGITCKNMNGTATARRVVRLQHEHKAFDELVGNEKPLLKTQFPVFERLQNSGAANRVYRNDGTRFKS